MVTRSSSPRARPLAMFALIVGSFAATLLPASRSSASAGDPEPARPVMTPQVSGSSIATLALANVGMMACSTNSLGGSYFGTSCTGNGGSPEYWCADFALWVWANAGVSNVSGLDAAAGSFYVYGQNNGTLSDTPAVGDAVVFDYSGGGVADHVAIVTQVNSDGTIETVSGDWGGTGSTEAGFASTSAVVLNSPAYASTVGSAPAIMGMTISGFIAPAGLGFDYGAEYVSQSFPLASTALTMTAGQTIPSYIELTNVGAKSWDSNTRIGTTQPRDRVSVFADSTWVATDRPAAVSGSVAPGDSYKFTFDLHAPATAGTYYEYFGVVEDGVAWFSDPGEGGPADDDLEVQVVVVDAPTTTADAGAADSGGGQSASDDAGAGGSAGSGGGSGGGSGSGSSGSTGSSTPTPADDGGAPANGASSNGGNSSGPSTNVTPSGAAATSAGCGCAITGAPQSSDLGAFAALLFGAAAATRRRRGGTDR
ncbi:MAG: CHAP domain-containing protein [Polyangiaceae bacterium]